MKLKRAVKILIITLALLGCAVALTWKFILPELLQGALDKNDIKKETVARKQRFPKGDHTKMSMKPA